MDYIGQETYRELLETRKHPSVSIYCEFDHQDRRGKNHRLEFRNAVDEAKSLLLDEYDEALVEDVVETLEGIAEDDDFWSWQSKGLAVFVSPDYARTLRLGTAVGDHTVVGTNFHTRPLLDVLTLPDRFWVLSLGRGETTLYEGTREGIEAVDLAGVPESLQDALQIDEPRHDLINKASPDRGTAANKPPIFHGYGAGEDDDKPHLRSFFTKVDEGLQNMLEGSREPVILAAPEREASMFREVTELENLADETIEASVSDWKESRLHEAAWTIASGLVQERVDRALKLWEQEFGRGSAEMDLQNIAKRTIQNQVRAIMIERDRHVWGTLDRDTGDISIVEEGQSDPSPDVDDLLDELAEYVILRGGQAIQLPTGQLPGESGAAAILR